MRKSCRNDFGVVEGVLLWRISGGYLEEIVWKNWFWMPTEFRQIESGEIEKYPLFSEQMLKRGGWVEGEIFKFTFWYAVEYFTSNPG